MRLLLVEDDATLAAVLRMAFGQRGWEVEEAATVAEALASFRAEGADVVLTDKNLPGGATGVDLVRELRKLDDGVGIIVMTGYGTAESARDTLNLGVDEYLEKPFPDVFAVEGRARKLAERAKLRRADAARPAGPLTILVAAKPARAQLITRWLDGTRDRLLFVETPDDVKPSTRTEKPDVVILDGSSFPEEITAVVVGVRTRARFAACVVLSEHVMLSDVRRLIELEVKALIDEPIAQPRAGEKLRAAIERLRRAAQRA